MKIVIPARGHGYRGMHWLLLSVMPSAKLPLSTVSSRILAN